MIIGDSVAPSEDTMPPIPCEEAPPPRPVWPVVSWVLGIVLTAFTTYMITAAASSDRVATLTSRVSVLESQSQQIGRDISEIKADLRALLRQSQP